MSQYRKESEGRLVQGREMVDELEGFQGDGDDPAEEADDAVGVGHLDGKALEKAFVDRIEEGLFLREIIQGGGSGFDGDIEAVQGLEEFGPAEVLGGEGFDHLCNFPGDDVAVDEVGIVENAPEEAQ